MNDLLRFLRRYYHVFLFLLLEGICVYFISCNSYRQGSYITSIANNVSGSVNGFFDNVTSYFYLRSTNEALVQENVRLRKMVESSYVKIVNNVHKEEDTVYKQMYSFIDARVIYKTVNKRNNFFMLNKGSISGIEPDMGVISPNGVVGVVIKTTPNFSLVMSVLHQDSKLNVRNERTKTTGTLLWNGKNYATGQIIDMPSSLAVKKGDNIVTSGFSRNFPEGISIGKIKSFKKDKGTGFYEIDIKFSTDYNKLEYVYVIKNYFKIEQDRLMQGIDTTNTQKQEGLQ
ncbi:MAG: rod shape-determining protein MreC [Bacteroidales bacterium]|nr:rod shape-determining protein MreC [Bacteroidales bacterium]MBQ9311590.1 rod shape-determining protein MreC [Bacteroidales bacterium]